MSLGVLKTQTLVITFNKWLGAVINTECNWAICFCFCFSEMLKSHVFVGVYYYLELIQMDGNVSLLTSTQSYSMKVNDHQQ